MVDAQAGGTRFAFNGTARPAYDAVRLLETRVTQPRPTFVVTAPATSVYTSICEPMITVRWRGRPRYSAASAVM